MMFIENYVFCYFSGNSCKIRPLAALYPPPPPIKKCYISGRWGRYAHAYGICVLFYCISLKKNYMYKAASSSLTLRDIAIFPF